jgi:hypothetical protein
LYAQVDRVQPKAEEKSLRLRGFRLDESGKSSQPSSLRAAVSAGSVSASGHLLDFSLPDIAAPQALAVAFTDGQVGGAAFLPLIGNTILPVKTRPGTGVRVRIAGTWFGPVEAKLRRTNLPILVPPGVRSAVVQAIGRRGNVTETFADLNTPRLPRIAAVSASESVGAGETIEIFVALASERGAAAAADSPIKVVAKRGQFAAPVSQGAGLWSITYKAPDELGADELEISVDGNPDAGQVQLALEVTAASTSKIVFTLPDKSYLPGEKVSGSVRATDSHGNLAPAGKVKLSFAGAAVPGTPAGDEIAFEFTVPETLPANREMELLAQSGKVTSKQRINTESGPAVEASIRAVTDEREAQIRIVARDQFGNITGAKAFSLEVSEATAGALMDGADGVGGLLTANPGARAAVVRVLGGSGELAREEIRFSPPGDAILLGAYAAGAWNDNLGDLSVLRAGGGVGLRRNLGSIETSLLAGVEGFARSDTIVVDVGGSDQRLSRSLRGLAIPVFLRGRLKVARTIGVALSAGLVPVVTSASLGMDLSGGAFRKWTLGTRGQMAGDMKLGPGRVNLGASFGRAKLNEGPIVGEVDGLRVFVGYEWWPLDLSE